MCGIIGYAGRQEALPIIFSGLQKLEYRGYDSAGICTISEGRVGLRRSEGKLVNLGRLLEESPLAGQVGIGHTRWATHGRPSEKNAHPHKAGPVIVVHNGIIENHVHLRNHLHRIGHSFSSDTDTEVIAHLIEQKMKDGTGFEESVRRTLQELQGAFAVCVLSEHDPDTLIAARRGSPLVVGLGDGEFFVASDSPAILAHTRDIVFLEDGEMAIIRNDESVFRNLRGETVVRQPRRIDWTPHQAEKNGYRHFMLKEIHEQPRAIQDTLAGRLHQESGDVLLDEGSVSHDLLQEVKRIVIIACGTSWHAGIAGKFLFEKRCRVPVEVDIASEFRYREPVMDPETLVIAISQSGETADTLAALLEAKSMGARTMAVCNVVDSSIARAAGNVLYTHAGPEIGVASTKAFITQLVALSLLSIRFGRSRSLMSLTEGIQMVRDLAHLSVHIDAALRLDAQVEQIASRFHHARNFLFLGRGLNYPLALEGALKLKELSYIHAEGYPAGEMKHGPIALIDEEMPVVVLAPRDRHYAKVFSNMEEVIARGGRVIAVCTEGDEEVPRKAEACITVPDVAEDLLPMLLSVPLQLLAYHVAVMKGTDVDQPRNLAKSVTVE